MEWKPGPEGGGREQTGGFGQGWGGSRQGAQPGRQGETLFIKMKLSRGRMGGQAGPGSVVGPCASKETMRHFWMSLCGVVGHVGWLAHGFASPDRRDGSLRSEGQKWRPKTGQEARAERWGMSSPGGPQEEVAQPLVPARRAVEPSRMKRWGDVEGTGDLEGQGHSGTRPAQGGSEWVGAAEAGRRAATGGRLAGRMGASQPEAGRARQQGQTGGN